MRNIAIIPARSGSKGIKNKNIKLLNGKPLISYSIEAAIESNIFNTVMVSTDSEEYAQIARNYGAQVPFLRSRETSKDSSGSWEVVKEVLRKYSDNGKLFDSVCLLQPTSPLRTKEDIVEAYDLYIARKADAVTSVCECGYHVQDMIELDNSLSLEELRKKEIELPRQLLSTYYRLNGAIFIRSIDYMGEKIIINNTKEIAYIMDTKKSIDIDTEYDFNLAEYIISRR